MTKAKIKILVATSFIGAPFSSECKRGDGTVVFCEIDDLFLEVVFDIHVVTRYYLDTGVPEDDYWITDIRAFRREEGQGHLKMRKDQVQELNDKLVVSQARFEVNNIDVTFSYTPTYYSDSRELKIEVKPVIHEDYMSIMRKAMKDGVNTLFCGELTATTASLEDIRKAFQRNDITFLTLAEVEAQDAIVVEHTPPLQLKV